MKGPHPSVAHGAASAADPRVIPGEDRAAFEALRDALLEEHQPATHTEELLIQEMAQSWWLTQRAIRLQNECFTPEGVDQKQLSLFLRYQTTHERAFHKCLNDLLKLRAERQKEQNGFVWQQQKQAEETRREARENRQKERHARAVMMDAAKLDYQILVNSQLPGSQGLVEKTFQRIINLENSEAAA